MSIPLVKYGFRFMSKVPRSTILNYFYDNISKFHHSVYSSPKVDQSVGFLSDLFDTCRYNVPSNKIKDEKTAVQVKLRVGIVLKYWIENHFDDFDKKTIETLERFLKEMSKQDSTSKLAEALQKELQRKVSIET